MSRTMNAAWWLGEPCEVCQVPLQRVRFFGKPPRLVAPDGTARDVSYVEGRRADELRASHALVCGDCYLHRFGDGLNAAKRRGEATPTP